MDFIDEITNRKCSSGRGKIYTIVTGIVDGILILGYTKHSESIVLGRFIGKNECRYKDYYYIPGSIPGMVFSKRTGRYEMVIEGSTEAITNNCILGLNLYPYTFEKKYEAVENFELFKNKQEKCNDINFPISEHVKRTIGIEFETSMGAVPEELCFKLGLIPLRDGSITGCEYSTIVLKGNSGFNLLFRQLEVLSEYTHFNKDCSLHIHFGDFPLDADKIWRLYNLLYYNTNELAALCPAYSFFTEKYKSNGKSYCKPLRKYNSFEQMFRDITGNTFFGSFVQPHPLDVERKHKWNVASRYYFCNFVNLLCYSVNKTVEFRFLRPTYNLEKILTWIYIFNAFLDFAETSKLISVDINTIISRVYPKPIVDFLQIQMIKLKCLKLNQESNGDYIGSDLILENKIFDSKLVI